MSLYTYYDDPEPLILEPNQHYSTPQNRPNSTPLTEPIQTNPTHLTEPTTHHTPPTHHTHLPPRRYYAPLPSPPDHHHHHHPTHPTYHPEGTMHLCLRPLTTTTTTTQPTPPTHHHTTQPPTHPPIRYECVFYHRCICSIVNKS